ncbi:hypothetical protein D6779_12170, partial [Candidatus Parcubacteria bacterium]
NVTQAAAGSIVTTGTGTIDVEATAGAITMADGAVTSTELGDIRYVAATDITLASLDAGSGNVGLQAGNSIGGTGSTTSVTANGLNVRAGNGVGTATAPLRTSVNVVSASVGSGGLTLSDSGSISIGSVGVSTRAVSSSGGGSLQAPDTFSAVTASGGGSVVLHAVGSITVTDTGGGGSGISVAGGGNVDLASSTGNVVARGKISLGGSGVYHVLSNGSGASVDTVVLNRVLRVASSSGAVSSSLQRESTSMMGGRMVADHIVPAGQQNKAVGQQQHEESGQQHEAGVNAESFLLSRHFSLESKEGGNAGMVVAPTLFEEQGFSFMNGYTNEFSMVLPVNDNYSFEYWTEIVEL